MPGIALVENVFPQGEVGVFSHQSTKFWELSLDRWIDELLQISPLAATSREQVYVKLSRQRTLVAGIRTWRKSILEEGIGGSSQSVGSVTVTKVKTRYGKRNLDLRATARRN